MERQITIREIAARAGVSTATVSNVLHGKTKRVSPATIERVRRIIDDMGYIGAVNGSVGSAGEENRPKLVILVVNSHKKHKDAIRADPFYGKMIGLVEQFLKQRGYYMMLCSASDMDDILRMAMSWQADGVITPALTTIRQDMRQKADLAVQCLLSLIEQPTSRSSPTACLPPKDILLPVRLIPRASTGPSCPRIP